MVLGYPCVMRLHYIIKINAYNACFVSLFLSWEANESMRYWEQFRQAQPQENTPEEREKKKKRNMRLVGYCFLAMLLSISGHYFGFRWVLAQKNVVLTTCSAVVHPNILFAGWCCTDKWVFCMKPRAKCFLLFMHCFSDESMIMVLFFRIAFRLSHSQTNPSRVCLLVSHNPWCLVMLSSISEMFLHLEFRRLRLSILHKQTLLGWRVAESELEMFWKMIKCFIAPVSAHLAF